MIAFLDLNATEYAHLPVSDKKKRWKFVDFAYDMIGRIML